MNEDKAKRLKPGEKGFAVALLAAALFMAYQSILLFIDNPDAAGPALMPLAASLAVAIAAAFIIIKNARRKTGAGFTDTIRYLLPPNVIAAIIAIVAYCAALKLGVSFFIVTGAFLWGLMTYLRKGEYLKNLAWTAVCLAFIYVVFKLCFNVMI